MGGAAAGRRLKVCPCSAEVRRNVPVRMSVPDLREFCERPGFGVVSGTSRFRGDPRPSQGQPQEDPLVIQFSGN